MSMDSGSDNEQLKIKKKKFSKKGQSVPSDSLGFQAQIHADIIDPRNMRRVPNRKKKKYTSKSNKQNFMNRLRMVIDVNDLPQQTQSHLFKVTSKVDWRYVRKVLYRSKQKIFCSICLEQSIIAPQITYCGHIFCFQCILMHFKISSNCFSCPVCKELTDVDEIKTCQPKFQQQFALKDQITFNLKYRQGNYIYEAENLLQDLNSTPIIRMRAKGIVAIYQKQLEQIKKQLEKTKQAQRNYKYLIQALQLSTKKLQKIKESALKHLHVHLRENEKLMPETDTIYRVLSPAQSKSPSMHSFYQQKSGSLIFLHKLCKRYLFRSQVATKQCTHPGAIPISGALSIKSIILQKQQLDFSLNEQEYRELSVFNFGCEVDVVIIDLKQYMSQGYAQYDKFLDQVSFFVKQRQEFEQRQECQLQRLRIQYEQQQEYIRKLKQQQQALYYFDVKLPPTLNPGDINQHSFPSLITLKSQTESQQKKDKQFQQLKIMSKSKTEQQTKTRFDITKQHQSFPDLLQIGNKLTKYSSSNNNPNNSNININSNNNKNEKIVAENRKQSEYGNTNANTTTNNNNSNSNNNNNRKKKKKKEKFIDVTHQFMFNRQEQQDD